MNYHHIYHAGNFADVFKHITLTLIIEYLKQKEKPFFILDTHAGSGVYNLSDEKALKTGESSTGILKVLTNEKLLALAPKYFEIITKINRGNNLNLYPGSPYFIAKLSRKIDRLHFCELYNDDYIALKRNFAGQLNIRMFNENGYQHLKSDLPPQNKRGLILIDPPYEDKDEFATLIENIKLALERFATGIYMIWYPIKDIVVIDDFYNQVKQTTDKEVLRADLLIDDIRNTDKLCGCGLMIINPPYTLDKRISELTNILNVLYQK